MDAPRQGKQGNRNFKNQVWDVAHQALSPSMNTSRLRHIVQSGRVVLPSQKRRQFLHNIGCAWPSSCSTRLDALIRRTWTSIKLSLDF